MWFLILIGILAILYLALDSFVIIPGPNFGVHLRFGKRTGRIYEEGFGWKIPFIDTVQLFSTELTTIPVGAEFTTTDKLQISIKGTLQFRADPRISDDKRDIDENARDRKGKNTFFSMSEDIIKEGIEDALKSLLGGLGGTYEGKQFIKNRQALGDMINSILRLAIPLHLNHNPITCGRPGCKLKEQKVSVSKLKNFYNTHWREVQESLKGEKNRTEECSRYELRYGIDIETFALATVKFSQKTEEAFETDQQAKAREEAFEHKLSMAEKAKERLGANAQEALDAADVSLDPAVKKQVVSVQGPAGVLGGIVNKMGGQ